MADSSRRRFLVMGAAAVATGACSGGSGEPPAQVGDVAAGSVADLPSGALREVGTKPVCIGRDQGGVYAMTLTCTHAGCTAGVINERVACPCHGSNFDRNGNVTTGPASSPLQHFAVSVDASGNLTIHGSTDVDAATRLKV